MANCGKDTIARRVTCGEPTKPPHTDEVNPGTCSRIRIFCVAPGDPDPDWACWQHIARYTLNLQERQFADCADAARQLAEDVKNEIPAATTEYSISVQAPKFVFSGSPSTGYTYTTTVNWQVDYDRIVINFPSYSWPNMSDADQNAVNAALGALMAHEEKHVTLTEEFVRGLRRNKPKITASGPDKDAAKAACVAKLRQHEAKVRADLARKQEEYDKKTDHGANQSADGGVDVKLECPPAGSQ